jgi:hypothetical protein
MQLPNRSDPRPKISEAHPFLLHWKEAELRFYQRHKDRYKRLLKWLPQQPL